MTKLKTVKWVIVILAVILSLWAIYVSVLHFCGTGRMLFVDSNLPHRSFEAFLHEIMVSGCNRPKPKPEMVIDRSDLVGLSLAVVTMRLGEPRHASEFTVGTAPTKNWDHGIVFGAYPKSDPRNLDVRLRELSWQDGDYVIHACFHRTNGTWVVLGTKRIHKYTRF